MIPFSKRQIPVPGVGDIHAYTGTPDCRTFHNWILDSLIEMLHPQFGPPNPPLTSLTTGHKGNLGEAITVLVGKTDRFSTGPFVFALGGALTPFNAGAQIGLDICILYLDPNGIAANDRLFIQEVKTTGSADLNYSKKLIEDYEKLLDTTTPTLSLMSRVSALKVKLKWEHNFPNDKLQRVEDLAQISAAACTRVRLLPTLIHDRGSDPSTALSHVMTEIATQGWSAGCIEAWSISLTLLDQTLIEMANRRKLP